MSLRPKHTSTFGESSSSKPQRCSRIAQPIRRPSFRERSLERSTSMDRINNGPFLTASSAVKCGRSFSATPMRTPNRPIPYAGSAVLLTNEKERAPLEDKKFVQFQAARVTEHLHAIEHTLGKDFFQRGGLKTMSTKQFAAIFEYLLKFIVGNRLKIGVNYVDDIVKVMAQIEYPFNLKKSWLRTPSAPHAFNHVVLLFGWMLNFVCNVEIVQDFEENYLIPAKDLPDKEYALKFMSFAKEGFSLWGNQKNEEFNNLKKDLSDNFIQKRTGLSGLDFLEFEIKHHSEEVGKLDRTKSNAKGKEECSKLDQECNKLSHEVRANQKELTKLENSCTEGNEKIERLEKLTENKQKLISELQTRIENIDGIIKTQKMTIKDRDDLITKVHHLQIVLKSTKNSVYQLQDMDATNQVLYSRLIKQTIDTVSNFNNYLYKIFSGWESVTDVNIQELCLIQDSETSLDDQLNEVVPILERLQRICYQQIKESRRQITEVENQLKIAVYEHDTLMSEKQTTIIQHCEDFAAKIEQLDIEIINVTGHRNKEVEEMSSKHKELIELNIVLSEEILVKDHELDRLKNENEAMLAKVDVKCQEILKAKKDRVWLLNASVTSLRNTLEEINFKLKDIP